MGLTAGMGMGELVAVNGAGMAGVDDDINWAASQGATPTASTGGDWGGIFNQVWSTASKVLLAQYGQPAPGTVITTPTGQYIRQANGMSVPVVSASVGVGASGGGLGTGTLVLLLVGVVAVVAMKGR